MQKPGLYIKTDFTRPDPALVASFAGKAAADISDVMMRLFAMDARIRPLGRGKKLIGTALTVKSALADNLMFHKALTLAKPGDVIVVNAGGDMVHSVCGDVMFRIAMSRGVAGLVIDGCVRDVAFLTEHDFPVFALGATPRGPYKSPVGEINTDIACGGQVVHPGDIIVGDADGIVVIRKDDAPNILAALAAQEEKEARFGRMIAEGRWEQDSPLLAMVNEKIKAAGFEVEE